MKRRTLYKKGLAFVLAGTLAMSALVGCGGDSSTSGSSSGSSGSTTQTASAENASAGKSDETLTFVLESEPTNLTCLNNATSGITFPEALGGSLLRYNDETKTADPSLASSYDKIDDTHYRFHLREDAVYSDGTPVTANDVLYSFKLYKATGAQDFVNIDVDNCVVEDDHTFVLALTQYFAGWEFCVSEGNSAIYSEAAVEAAGGLDAPMFAPIGCGRYEVAEWKSGEYLLLERNENYWDDDYEGYYKYLKFIFISDSASRVMSVRSGDADIANRISTADYISLQNDSTAYGWAYDCGVNNQVFFNCETGPCTDVTLREALCRAIDPEGVNAVLNLGTGEVSQGMWASSFPFYRDYYGGSLYDPEKAKELLAEAGYSDGITLTCICTSTFKDAATVVQESLRQVGVELEVSVLESATFLEDCHSGNYDLVIGNNAISSLNSNAFNIVDPAKIGSATYNVRYNTPEMVQAVADANSPDEATQEKGFDELYDITLGNYCLLGLCNGDKYLAVRQGITGMKVGTRMGYIDISECHPE